MQSCAINDVGQDRSVQDYVEIYVHYSPHWKDYANTYTSSISTNPQCASVWPNHWQISKCNPQGCVSCNVLKQCQYEWHGYHTAGQKPPCRSFILSPSGGKELPHEVTPIILPYHNTLLPLPARFGSRTDSRIVALRSVCDFSTPYLGCKKLRFHSDRTKFPSSVELLKVLFSNQHGSLRSPPPVISQSHCMRNFVSSPYSYSRWGDEFYLQPNHRFWVEVALLVDFSSVVDALMETTPPCAGPRIQVIPKIVSDSFINFH